MSSGVKSGNVKVFFDPRDIAERITIQTLPSLDNMTIRVLSDTNNFVPLSQGVLRDSPDWRKTKPKGRKDKFAFGAEIIYSRPLDVDGEGYEFHGDAAHSVYEGMNPVTEQPIHKWTTPGTGPYWFETAKNKYLDTWVRDFVAEVRLAWSTRKAKSSKK